MSCRRKISSKNVLICEVGHILKYKFSRFFDDNQFSRSSYPTFNQVFGHLLTIVTLEYQYQHSTSSNIQAAYVLFDMSHIL